MRNPGHYFSATDAVLGISVPFYLPNTPLINTQLEEEFADRLAKAWPDIKQMAPHIAKQILPLCTSDILDNRERIQALMEHALQYERKKWKQSIPGEEWPLSENERLDVDFM